VQAKGAILARLGESELLLPTLVSRALAANDRAKYLFTLLQSAVRHADRPDEALAPTCGASGSSAGSRMPTSTPISCQAEELDEGTYRLATGIRAAPDRLALERYLEHLGSRLVFLIDWNRARKRLRRLVKGSDAVELLRWAAERDLGHMAFLALGGERLIFDALERLPRVAIHYGEQLHEVLGRERAIAFLRFVLERCSTGIRGGKSEFLIRDEIRAELVSHVATAQQCLLSAAAEHASLVVELAASLRDGLQRFPGEAPGDLDRAAQRAAAWEHQADGLLEQARVLARRWSGAEAVERLLVEADDAADHLEDVTFLLTLLPGMSPRGEELVLLAELADLTLAASREHPRPRSPPFSAGRPCGVRRGGFRRQPRPRGRSSGSSIGALVARPRPGRRPHRGTRAARTGIRPPLGCRVSGQAPAHSACGATPAFHGNGRRCGLGAPGGGIRNARSGCRV
jgi:hypothetical protein